MDLNNIDISKLPSDVRRKFKQLQVMHAEKQIQNKILYKSKIGTGSGTGGSGSSGTNPTTRPSSTKRNKLKKRMSDINEGDEDNSTGVSGKGGTSGKNTSGKSGNSSSSKNKKKHKNREILYDSDNENENEIDSESDIKNGKKVYQRTIDLQGYQDTMVVGQIRDIIRPLELQKYNLTDKPKLPLLRTRNET